jgi:nitrate reductase gamma subunit
MRYISLFQDYFLLLFIAAVIITGILVRHVERIDLMAVKEYALGLLAFHPVPPKGAGPTFYLHIALALTLIAIFPFSKMVHAAGMLLSPTRNLANTGRSRRHENPWNGPVPVHTYEEWEEEFRDKLIKSGYTLEKHDGG